MSRLIIVAGASGAGKTFMLSELSKYRNDIVPIKKYTTRGPRKNEPKYETIDLHLSCTSSKIKECDYTYHFNGHTYGIKKSEINIHLHNNKNPIVIVANCNTISKMKKDYPNAIIMFVHSGLSGEDLKEQLLKYNDPLDVSERMKRHHNSYNEYLRHISQNLFDYVLVNFFDNTFIEQVDYILNMELELPTDVNFIFVIMSFDPKYDDTYEAIKTGGKLVKKYDLEIQRVSEHKGDYIITEWIERSINKAEIIICDVSERSPNVYYELGYARAKNKKIILTAKSGTELPFDVRQYSTKFYNSDIQLQKIITEELEHYFA
ncbi:MAG: hypothetical protein U0K87_00555 [Ruminococcus sp.]|nr:hypothetical protein [Ruminococcus sp.]